MSLTLSSQANGILVTCRHDRAMRVGKALAATAVEVLTSKALLAKIQREFNETKVAEQLQEKERRSS